MSDAVGIDVARELKAGEAYLEAGNPGAAIESAKQILRKSAEELEALDLLARAFLAKDDHRNAETAARDFIALAPESGTGHRLLAVAALGLKKKDLAKQEALKAIECEPWEASNHLTLAVICEERDEFAECEAAYRHALDLYPAYTAAKTRYGDFLVTRGRAAEAKQLLAVASGEAAGDPGVIILRGTIALREGRIDEAYENALWALQHDAMDPQAIHLMAQVKMRKNPILGIWWRYATMMGRFTGKQQIFICIGIYLAWQVLFRGFLAGLPSPVPEISLFLWVGFCILTWVAPGILRRMINRELKSVQIKNF